MPPKRNNFLSPFNHPGGATSYDDLWRSMETPDPETARTSKSHPYRIDWLPANAFPSVKGRLGLGEVPGKKFSSKDIEHDRDLQADLDRIKEHHKVSVIVSLIEAHEYPMVGSEAEFDEAGRRGISGVWYPIQDRTVPEDSDTYLGLLKRLRSYLGHGKRVLVHCRAGHGRAGMTASCLLVLAGWEPNAAIQLVRKTRERTIKNPLQVEFVKLFSAWLKDPGTNIIPTDSAAMGHPW